MIIARSLWRKGFATALAAGALVSLHGVTILDSQFAARLAGFREPTALPGPGARLSFSATAYCRGATTTSGVAAQKGVAAADPQLLPVGSVVQVDATDIRYNGIYRSWTPGPSFRAAKSTYVWNCDEAVRFGRRPIHLVVLRLGWNPGATTPSFMDRIFKRQDPAALPPLPSRTLLAPAGGS